MYKNKRLREQHNNSSKLFIIITAVILVVIALMMSSFNWVRSNIYSSNSDDTTEVYIKVETGSSTSEIGQILEDNNLIQSTFAWDIFTRINNPNLLAAEFYIPRNYSIPEIVELMSRAPKLDVVRITIPEGFKNQDIATLLEEQTSSFETSGLVSEFLNITTTPDIYVFEDKIETFLTAYKPEGKSLEGFLYPDTYEFDKSATALDIVNRLVDNFISKVDESGYNEELYDNLYYYLTLSSIVEAESLDDNDRDIIAGVFTNRLRDGYRLEADSTINYATGKSERRVQNNLTIETPYNTYLYAGLTPTPINNPRIESIIAAVNPPATDYYFFLHAEDGTAYYAVTFDEHQLNICRYLDESC